MKKNQQTHFLKMLRGLTLILALSHLSNGLYAQVLTTENFSGSSIGSLTTTSSTAPWRYQGATHACTVPSTDNHEWSVRSGNHNGNPTTGFTGNYAVVQSDYGTDCQGDSYMAVCRFTVPAGMTSVKITYNHYYDDWASDDFGYVYVFDRTAGAFLNASTAYKTYTADQGTQSAPVSDGFTLTGLTSGSVYDVRFRYIGNNDYYWLVDDVVATANNDDCANAYPMTVNANGSCVSTVTANTAGMTNSNVTPSGACTSNSGTPDDDIWYSFVAPASGGVILQGTYVSGASDVYYQIFSGACGATMTSLKCFDTDAGTVLTGLTSGTTYRLRFYTWSSGVSSSYTLCMQAYLPSTAPQGSTTCATPTKLCSVTGQTLTFAATVGAANASATNPGNAYGCLATTPRPSWFYLQMENSGSLDINLQGYDVNGTTIDNDFALYGPFANLAAAQSACGTYTAGQLIDCSYAAPPTPAENVNIPSTAVAGEVYVLLVTAYSDASYTFTLQQQATSTGTSNCSGVAGACDISNATLSNLSVCNNNSTVLATDDYYTADVTVTFANKPATGNLQLTGAGIHSGTYAVAVASTTTATTHIFTGVKIKADGNSQTILADFSTLTGCNFIKSGIAGVSSCSCAASMPTLNVTAP
jgi:hypothetical protein